MRLLRLLEENPGTLASLTGSERPPALTGDILPFEVTSEHIAFLTDRTFPVLLRKLLSVEAQAHGLLSTEFTSQAVSHLRMVEKTDASHGPEALPVPHTFHPGSASSK